MKFSEISDYELREEAKRRKLFPKELCPNCQNELLDIYSYNGVLDDSICPNATGANRFCEKNND